MTNGIPTLLILLFSVDLKSYLYCTDGSDIYAIQLNDDGTGVVNKSGAVRVKPAPGAEKPSIIRRNKYFYLFHTTKSGTKVSRSKNALGPFYHEEETFKLLCQITKNRNNSSSSPICSVALDYDSNGFVAVCEISGGLGFVQPSLAMVGWSKIKWPYIVNRNYQQCRAD